jgi:HD superfamily phosphohydrolase
MVVNYVRSLFADRHNPFWRIAIEEIDIYTLLVTALVHDLGHFSYGHAVEELIGIFAGHTHQDYAISLAQGAAGSLPHPKVRRDDCIELATLVTQFGVNKPTALLEEVALLLSDPEPSLHVFDSNSIYTREGSQALKVQILRSIINSAIDADKLDYLLRDAHHCGVQYANGIDVDRFFQSLTCITHLSSDCKEALYESADVDKPYEETGSACVGVTDKGILPTESILIARYQMFSSVYWHHTVRAYTAVLQLCVQEFVGIDRENLTERIELLMCKFRELPDNTAVAWLLSELKKKKNVSNAELRHALIAACCGLLGDKACTYRQYFELHYEAHWLKDISPTSDQRETAESILDNLWEKWDVIHGNRSGSCRQPPWDTIEKLREFRRNFTQQLEAALSRDFHFYDGEVLIDIPPPNRDQVDDIFVVTPDSRTVPIQHMSPVAGAVRDAFRRWVRTLRVFISRKAESRFVNAGIEEEVVRGACAAVMRAMANRQYVLKFEEAVWRKPDVSELPRRDEATRLESTAIEEPPRVK